VFQHDGAALALATDPADNTVPRARATTANASGRRGLNLFFVMILLRFRYPNTEVVHNFGARDS
jgi:hypothetical protein